MTTTASPKPKVNALVRWLPILGWLPKYKRAWLVGDIVAGLSVWALMVPQSLGYATVSGVPVQYGLYAAAIALLIYPIFASSRHAVTGPSSTIAAVTGAAVLAVTAGSSTEAIQLVALITVLAGLLYLLLALLKMGWISNFLSESVLTGFIFGIGIDVVVGQLGKLTGSPQSGANTWQKLASWLQGLPELNVPTLIVGGGLLILLIVLKLFAPKVPGALVAVVLGIGAASAFGLASMGVALTGEVPSGLPSFVLPSLSVLTQNLGVVLPAAIGVLLVGLSESLAAARQYSAKYHYDIDVNQEMLAQGMANTASGLFQGINVDGSLSKSSLNDASGAKTELASLAQGVFVILTLLFLAPLFANLPKAALAAIVIEAVAFGLWKIPEMRRLARLSRIDFAFAMAALLGVLTFGTLQGVFIGVFLSLLWLVWRASHPSIPVLGRAADGKSYHSIDSHSDATIVPGVVVLRLDGPLFFATASGLRNRVRALTRDVTPPVYAVVLDLEGADVIDLQGSDELREIAKELKDVGVTLLLARVKADIRQNLARYGTLDVVPNDHFFDAVDEAVAAAGSERKKVNAS
jgi:sulfate permease, SulP family